MSVISKWRQRWAQASLEYDLAHGRRAYGRSDPSQGSSVEAEMPVAVTIEATVIRADGSREELGTISENTQAMTAAQLARMREAAARQQRRSKR